MSARRIEKWRAIAQRQGWAFPPPGPPLPENWTWLCASGGRPAHFATHNSAPLVLTKQRHGYHATAGEKALRQADGVYYADGTTGIVCCFQTAYEAAAAVSAYWQEATRQRRSPSATYVEVVNAPGLRWEQSDTPAGEGFVWLRPAFTAMRTPISMVKPWK